jgi:hypothetical protein
VDRALADAMTGGITAAWRLGWQPADLVRYAIRTHGRRAGRMMTDMIAAELRAYPAATVDERWPARLAALGADIWWDRDETYLTEWAARNRTDHATATRCALQVITLLRTLPRLHTLCPPPGEARPAAAAGHADRRMLHKIRALLAKAESTPFPEEAEALTARAQELMARHSIDQALLAARTGQVDDGPVGRRLPIDDPYEAPKAVLLGAIVQANRCRAIWSRPLGFSTVLGFADDLDAVELLFTSLLVQATSALVQERGDRARTRGFRRSFLASYAVRIGERLAEVTDATARQAAADDSHLLPVLAARDRAVDEAMNAMFPQVTGCRMRGVTDREGWVSGQAAADRADLSARRSVP